MEGLAEHAQIVIRAMKDQFAIPKGFKQRSQVEVRESVHEEIPFLDAELKQAEFFRVGVKAIGLAIHSDPG